MAPLRNLTEDEVFLRSYRRNESGRFENSNAVSLRADADAHQLLIRPAAHPCGAVGDFCSGGL